MRILHRSRIFLLGDNYKHLQLFIRINSNRLWVRFRKYRRFLARSIWSEKLLSSSILLPLRYWINSLRFCSIMWMLLWDWGYKIPIKGFWHWRREKIKLTYSKTKRSFFSPFYGVCALSMELQHYLKALAMTLMQQLLEKVWS